MKLKSFGCSFIYGSELADCNLQSPTPSRLTWPALLAEHRGYEYYCAARGGSGNLHILNSILAHIDDDPALFVINWTWIDRFDYIGSDELWHAALPGYQDKITDFYYRNMHSQYTDKLKTLTYINTAITALLARHQFIMTYMDNLIFETEFHYNSAIKYLQNSVRPHLRTFDGDNLLDFARRQGHAVSDLWHPLESAHQAASAIAATWI